MVSPLAASFFDFIVSFLYKFIEFEIVSALVSLDLKKSR